MFTTPPTDTTGAPATNPRTGTTRKPAGKARTGTSRKPAGKPRTDDNITRAVEIAATPPLKAMADQLPARANPDQPRGRPAKYPLWLGLWCHAAARVFDKGGRNELSRALRQPGEDALWARLRRAAEDAGLDPLPADPPSREWLRGWRDRFAAPDQLELLQIAYRTSMIEFAQQLGNLRPGRDADLTQLDYHNAIGGDGTVLHRFSDSEIATDLETGEPFVVHGTTDDVTRLRPQARLTHAKKDNKTVLGINHVTAPTMTDYGRLILDVEQAFGGEALTAFAVMDRVCRDAAGGVHAIVYDTALTGHHAKQLAAVHGAWVVNKPPKKQETHDLVAAATEDAKKKARGLWNAQQADRREGTAERGSTTRQGKQSTVPPALRAPIERRAVAAAVAEVTTPTLGTSIYTNSKGDPIVVAGAFHQLGTYAHDTATGVCEHHLSVDDGALFDVDPDTDIKLDRCIAQSAVLTRAEPGQPYRMVSRWRVPCRHGDFLIDLDYDLDVRQNVSRSSRERALYWLQPVHRLDGGFQVHHKLRSLSEAFHSWAKKMLRPAATKDTHRAASLLPEHQLMDVMGIGLLQASVTWQEYLRQRRAT